MMDFNDGKPGGKKEWVRFDLKSYLEYHRNKVNRHLGRLFSNRNGRVETAMYYALAAGGKRLRPILCIAGAESLDGFSDSVVETAAAIEMIHTYSLIHDDLPAMDNDVLRRGKPTCHVAFDEATAVLAGDALLTLAFQRISMISGDVPPERVLEVLRRVSAAAGWEGMIQGQMLDMSAENEVLTSEALSNLHGLKTGALIEASVCCGGVLAGGGKPEIDRLAAYGREIGLAFQITDDILNVVGDPSIMGKAAGTDAQRGKNTYPALIGLEGSKRLAEATVEKAFAAVESFGERAVPLRAVASYILTRNK